MNTMKKTILSLSIVAALVGAATPANAQSDLFFQGLKNPMVLDINEVSTENGITIDYNDAKDLYNKTTITFDDFFGGVTLSMYRINENSQAVACLSASTTVGEEGFKGDAETLYMHNDYILGYYDFNKDGHDEIVIVTRSKNEENNQMAMLVAFPCSEIEGNFAFEEVLGDAPQGMMTAVLNDGLITVSAAGNVVFRLKWVGNRFETIYD